MTAELPPHRAPALALEAYFPGRSRAYGVFSDRFGRIRRQFQVQIDGAWNEAAQTLELNESFRFDDGASEERCWRIRKTGPARYEGRAGDLVGVAHGQVKGNALRWCYDMDLNMGGRRVRVACDDRLWLQDDEVLLNQTEFRKCGVRLGAATIFFRRLA